MADNLHFQPIDIQHRDVIQPFLLNDSQTCDRTFTNLFCWQDYYHTLWAEVPGWLVIRACINGERRAAYIVLPQNETPDYDEIIPLLENDAAKQGIPLTLMGLSDLECDLLQRNYPGTFLFDRNRDFADYVYRAEDLRTLKGRKYAQKRNHVNKFKSLYSYYYEPITSNNINDCLRLESSWVDRHHDDESALAEYTTIQRALQHYDELELYGGALYVDNQTVAYTYGSFLNETMFCTHVEKADIHYEGVYQMINYLFAQHLPDHYTFINREEDMGIPGLRKSKLSYEPVRLAYKTTALKMTSTMRDIVHLWQTCFGESDLSVYTFLSRYYFEHCAITEKIDGHVVSMAFMIPCETEFGTGAYLYGIATLPEYQRQGISSRLIQRLLEKCKESGAVFSFLIPANEELVDFYDHFGYKPTRTKVKFLCDMDLGTGNPEDDLILALPIDTSFDINTLTETLECTPIL